MKVELKNTEPATYDDMLFALKWIRKMEKEKPMALRLEEADSETIIIGLEQAIEAIKLFAPIRTRAVLSLIGELTEYFVRVFFHKRKLKKFNIFQKAKHGWKIAMLVLQVYRLFGCKNKKES